MSSSLNAVEEGYSGRGLSVNPVVHVLVACSVVHVLVAFVAFVAFVDDTIGGGVSVSGGMFGVSVSGTLPLTESCEGTINSGNPVYEVGLGSSGISATAGSGMVIGRAEIGDIGRWILELVF